MKTIIHEIRQQPHHVREIATIVCTVVAVAVIVFVWFNSFQKNIYTLLNPEEQTQGQDKVFAQESQSLFSSILKTISDGTAQISNIFKGKSQTDVINNQPTTDTVPNNSIHPLPVSGAK